LFFFTSKGIEDQSRLKGLTAAERSLENQITSMPFNACGNFLRQLKCFLNTVLIKGYFRIVS